MLRSLVRKARQVAGDPVLRQWLLRCLKGGVSGPPPFAAHRQPYLNGMAAGNAESKDAAGTFRGLAAGPPAEPIELPLAGTNVALAPGDEDGVFKRSFDDVETLLALHRFAWVPLATGDGIAASWAQALWSDPDRIELPARPTNEPRFLIVGRIMQAVWTATVTYRHESTIRLISVRRARQSEEEKYREEDHR